MAFDTFLKLEGVDGESTADGHAGEIEIYSFSWGASNPVTIGSGASGLTGGKVSVSSFNVMKKTEKSSCKLFSYCCKGKHIPTGEVVMRKATGDGGQQTFLKYTFGDIMVESVQWSGSTGGDDSPTESLSLAFGNVKVEYFIQGDDGAMAAAGTASWDSQTVKGS